MIPSNARVSSSTRCSSWSLSFCPFSAQGEKSFTRSSQPLLMALPLATMVPSAAPRAPESAAILPPPGATESLAVSLVKALTLMETRRSWAKSFKRYSMILVLGSNWLNSFNPILLMAISTKVCSSTPLLMPCFSRKYLPASSMGCKGTSPTNSLPVTLTPRSSADLQVSSKTT